MVIHCIHEKVFRLTQYLLKGNRELKKKVFESILCIYINVDKIENDPMHSTRDFQKTFFQPRPALNRLVEDFLNLQIEIVDAFVNFQCGSLIEPLELNEPILGNHSIYTDYSASGLVRENKVTGYIVLTFMPF